MLDFNEFDIDEFVGHDRKQLLEEAVDIIRYGDLSQSSESVTDNEEIAKRVEEFFIEKISLNEPDAVLLDEEELKRQVVKKSEIESFLIYNIEIPVGLWSSMDQAFTHMICEIKFGSENNAENDMLIIKNIFPETLIHTQATIQIGLNVGIDNNLQYKVVDDSNENGASAAGKSSFVFGPFHYQLFRKKVNSACLGLTCKWEFEGRENIEKEQIKLMMIIKAPKDKENPIHISGWAAAWRKFPILTADIKAFFPYFTKPMQTLFKKNLPVCCKGEWDIQLPVAVSK